MANAQVIHEAPRWMQDGVWDLNALYNLATPDPQERHNFIPVPAFQAGKARVQNDSLRNWMPVAAWTFRCAHLHRGTAE